MPPGFALSADAFQAFVASAAPGTSRRVARRRGRGRRSARTRSRACARDAGRRSRGDRGACRRSLGEPPVAVRSSALGEDSAGGDLRRPAGDLPVGARRRRGLRRGARLLGEPLQPRGDQLPRAARRSPTSAGDGSHRAADGRRRRLRRDVHLQPGQRRPEHGRDQRQLGPRAGGRRRRGHARRLPASARSPARSCAQTISDKRVEYVPDPDGPARSRSTSPTSARARAASTTTALAALVDVGEARRAPLRLATRTSSGRSPRGAARQLFVLQSRPVTAVAKPDAEAGARRRRSSLS